jgi:hypothetical protein
MCIYIGKTSVLERLGFQGIILGHSVRTCICRSKVVGWIRPPVRCSILRGPSDTLWPSRTWGRTLAKGSMGPTFQMLDTAWPSPAAISMNTGVIIYGESSLKL